MDISFKTLVISCLVGLTIAERPWNMRRQFPDGANVQRRVDGHMVFGSANEIDTNNVVASRFENTEDQELEPQSDIGSLQALNKVDVVLEEPGFIDSILGQGVQSRIVGSLNGWVLSKAKSNPGCVERFVCETYRTGESLNGIPYLAMSLTNAAVSFMVADMFDDSVNIKEITKAARQGRTVGSCHMMKCDFMDGQLRTLENYFEVAENFIATIYNSVAGSLSLGK